MYFFWSRGGTLTDLKNLVELLKTVAKYKLLIFSDLFFLFYLELEHILRGSEEKKRFESNTKKSCSSPVQAAPSDLQNMPLEYALKNLTQQ